MTRNKAKSKTGFQAGFMVGFIAAGILAGAFWALKSGGYFGPSRNDASGQRPLAALLEDAGRAFNSQSYDEARRLYEEVLAQDQGNYDANRILAVIEVRNSAPPKLESALSHLNTAIKVKRDYVELIFLGEVLWKNRQYAESEAVFRECLKLKPNDYHALEQLGYVIRQQKRDAEALRYYKRALKVRPDSPTVKEAIASLASK